MKNNQLNGTVKIDISGSNEVQWVDLRNNSITQADVQGNTSIWIAGNPVCSSGSSLLSSESCQNTEQEKSYETVMGECGDEKWSGELKHNPKTCNCQQPYEGEMIFRAPSFSDLTDTHRFKDLEDDLKSDLGVDAIYRCCLYFDGTEYLIVPVKFFPADCMFFTRSEGLKNLAQRRPLRCTNPSPHRERIATSNFCESNGVGSGGYGKVYKTLLPEGEMVAIKRAQQGSLQGGTEFKNEIELLFRVHHKNLVELIGFCTEQEEQMLVYEYIPNGTLRQNLIGESKLDRARRLQIALGSAKGLNYRHELTNPPIIHGDVKSCNILLDENLNAKVADFGLSKLVADGGVDAGGKSHVSTQVKGTLGYLDPEYSMTRQLSEKSDVYSFGNVLLELITARLPIEGGKYIVRLVKEALESGGIELGTERPTMREVVKDLESIVEIQDPYQSIRHSLQSGPIGVKGPGNFYSEDEECISMVLAGQGEEDHKNSFEYSGAYQVSGSIEPK
ncbi:hypothetical protein SUGI_0691650 [Cryptomeria japonica]|nr:hypothetical protein SUGI_0691650 [Cryptomeria japonica]